MGIATALMALLGLGLASAQPLDDSERNPGGTPKCVEVRAQALYRGYGYDHVVDIQNVCDKPVDCSVRTDVNPEVTNLTIPPHELRSVVTFRGSPAREFKPDVQCKLQ
jgi:hypothetical protein